MSLFGDTGNLFGGTSGGTNNLFGSTGSSTTTTSTTDNLFGNSTTAASGSTTSATNNLFGTPAPAPATGGTDNLFGSTTGGSNNLFGSTTGGSNNLFGSTTGGSNNLFGSTTGASDSLFGGSANTFGTSTFGATNPQARLPNIWPDESTLSLKYGEIVKKDKERLAAYCAVKTNNAQPGTFPSEFQMYFEREPVNKTQKKVPSYLPAGYFTRRNDPWKGGTPQLAPVGVMVLLYQYDQKIREINQTVSEKIQPVIHELKKLSADLRRNTLKQKNAMANKYHALKLADASVDEYSNSGDGTRTLREILTRDIRIMQYVTANDAGGGTIGANETSEYPSSHMEVEVNDLYRRKRELAIQIRELESALLDNATAASSDGDLSSDLVRIIEEQFKMYEHIAAKVAVIHRRVEEEKQAIRAELRANPDGKGDPWYVGTTSECALWLCFGVLYWLTLAACTNAKQVGGENRFNRKEVPRLPRAQGEEGEKGKGRPRRKKSSGSFSSSTHISRMLSFTLCFAPQCLFFQSAKAKADAAAKQATQTSTVVRGRLIGNVTSSP